MNFNSSLCPHLFCLRGCSGIQLQMISKVKFVKERTVKTISKVPVTNSFDDNNLLFP